MTRYARLKKDIEFYDTVSYEADRKMNVPIGTIVEVTNSAFLTSKYKLTSNQGLAFVFINEADKYLEFLND